MTIQKPILQNFNLNIQPGEFVGILGKNGSGKTTLIKSLLQLIPYDSADSVITIDDYNLNLYDKNLLRQRICCIPQEPFLLNQSIDENIIGNCSKIHQQNQYPTEIIKHFLDKNFNNPNLQEASKTIGLNGKNLSHGQRQILAFLREIFRIQVGDSGNRLNVDVHDGISLISSEGENFSELSDHDRNDDTAIMVDKDLDLARNANFEAASSKNSHKSVEGLSKTSKLLILDEPTSFLDAKTEQDFCSILNSIRKKYKLTVIIIAHKKQTIESLCDRIIDLDER